jgi:flagellin
MGLVSITTLDINTTTTTLIGAGNEEPRYPDQGHRCQRAGSRRNHNATRGLLPDRHRFATTGTAASGTAIALTAATTDAQVDDMIRVVDSMLTQMTDAASNLGAVNKRDLDAGRLRRPT